MEGDPAWTTWFDQHGPALLLFARQWAPAQADAEDIVQEAFVRFWRSREKAMDAKTYLYSCVRNTAVDWLRAGARRLKRDQAAARGMPRHAEPLFEQSLEQDELRTSIENRVRSLPEDQRKVLVMKLWGGLTFAQIAEVLDISPNTAASRYRYALDAMRKTWSRAPQEKKP